MNVLRLFYMLINIFVFAMTCFLCFGALAKQDRHQDGIKVFKEV
jgi:hypothetical protein